MATGIMFRQLHSILSISEGQGLQNRLPEGVSVSSGCEEVSEEREEVGQRGTVAHSLITMH